MKAVVAPPTHVIRMYGRFGKNSIRCVRMFQFLPVHQPEPRVIVSCLPELPARVSEIGRASPVANRSIVSGARGETV